MSSPRKASGLAVLAVCTGWLVACSDGESGPPYAGPSTPSAGSPGTTEPSAGTAGAGGAGGVAPATATCPDSVEWTPSAPAACADAPPWASGVAPEVELVVDASALGAPWSRFYEKVVASDHANTVRCTAFGRNIQNALRRAHDQAGFQYVRFHGILDDDIGVYHEDANGAAVYDWTRFDEVYDAILATGMRPLVEISFTPAALASDPTKVQRQLWYNKASPNISPPRDWNRWQEFMADIVRHLEGRYGVDEIRNHWYFEVWNEPSWMYSEGDGGYPRLYMNTVQGLLKGDPEVRVGGPAGSAAESVSLIPALFKVVQTYGLKLDFITYHRYANDQGHPIADANGMADFHQQVVTLLDKNGFTGEVLNDEFGPSSAPDLSRDTECGASFIAKTIHLLGTSSSFPPPTSYGYWALSDLYEEINTGQARAYREGNYGLLLKGDPRFVESFDVAKPAFNALRLLHRLGDTQVSVTGGTTGEGVNALATLSASRDRLQVLVYNHLVGGRADSSASSMVSLNVKGLSLFPGSARVRHYVIDRNHANSYRPWVAMNRPKEPTQEQWAELRDAAELCYYETTAEVSGDSWTLTFPQNVYSVSLIELGS